MPDKPLYPMDGIDTLPEEEAYTPEEIKFALFWLIQQTGTPLDRTQADWISLLAVLRRNYQRIKEISSLIATKGSQPNA